MANNMKPCPFCGAEVKNAFPEVCEYMDGGWALSHLCDIEADEIRTSIHIFGKTREEVVRRWNGNIKGNA